MKHIYSRKRLGQLALMAFLSTGCQKIHDYVGEHPGAEIRTCTIRQFIYHPLHSGDPDTLTFTYNATGDPVKVTRREPRTGAPNFQFKYKNGKLAEFIGVYKDGQSTESWHRYSYSPNGLVSVDSVYNFAKIVGGLPEDPIDSYAITFQYDNKGRIIHEKRTYPDGSFFGESFQYNSDGNRVGAQYGQNVSIRRTNKIWMFLDRNYSINDRLGSSNHNASYMPTSITLGSEDFDIFLQCYFGKATIDYLCK